MAATGYTSALSATLRITSGVFLMGCAIAAGYLARSPWIIAVLALAFTVSFVFGKWKAWTNAAEGGSLGKAIVGLPVTYLVQLILVGLLYLIGRGAGALIGPDRSVVPLDSSDWVAAAALAFIGAVAGLIIASIESRAASKLMQTVSTDGPARADLRILNTPVTPQSVFSGIHYSHGNTSTGGSFDGTPNQKSEGSDAKILAAEARLSVQLPEGLKAIYRVQNGGSINDLCIPKQGAAGDVSYDDVIMPFSGYDDLYPTETLRSVYDSVTDYATPGDPDYADDFPPGCENMTLIAQWYRESLFLDYNSGSDPRVGFADFDDPDWADRAIWWDNFDAFFSALRHFETL